MNRSYVRHVVTQSNLSSTSVHLTCLCGWEYLGRSGPNAHAAENHHIRTALQPPLVVVPREKWWDIFKLD